MAIASLLAFSVLAGPDDDFIVVYQLIQRTDSQREAGQLAAAREGYEQARDLLQALKRSYPNWNERVVAYRLRYVADKLAILPAVTNAPAAVIVGEPAATQPANEVIEQFTALTSQIAGLQTEKQRLEAKLREALTAQPALVDPKELQAAVQRITDLQATNKVLLSQLESQQTERKNLVDKVLLEEARDALKAANEQVTQHQEKAVELERLRNLAAAELKRLREVDVKALTAENSTLKSQVQELQTETDRGGQIANLTERLTKLQQQLEQSGRENQSLMADRDKLEQQLRDLRARQSEESIVKVKQLETDLALARAESERHAITASQLEAKLVQVTGESVRFEQENRELAARIEALTEQATDLNVLKTQLSAEQEERAELEAQLRAAEDRLAILQTPPKPAPDSGRGATVPDPGLVAQVQMLDAETARLREALRDGRARQTELASLLAEAEKSRSRLETEKRELIKSLATAQTHPTQKQLARADRTIKSLEERVRELEGERNKLSERLAQATAKSKSNLQFARRARLGNPREDAVRFRNERNN
ncbi:MAG TPA: hypothetical protein DCE44_21215 [Verrucomicrobiales bacterium]|nr:hypothetical protein [Verrucomicrobiales bacterium]